MALNSSEGEQLVRESEDHVVLYVNVLLKRTDHLRTGQSESIERADFAGSPAVDLSGEPRIRR